jgi:hypothetical protein
MVKKVSLGNDLKVLSKLSMIFYKKVKKARQKKKKEDERHVCEKEVD